MKEEMPKATVLTSRTLMPAAAAARSFERTASICRPSPLRRRLATKTPQPTTTARQTNPKSGLGILPSDHEYVAPGPRSKPKMCGEGVGEPLTPPPQDELSKTKCSSATAAAI